MRVALYLHFPYLRCPVLAFSAPPHCCYTALTWQLLVLGVSRNYHATLLMHCNPDSDASDISIAPDALRRAICATDRSITANEKHRGGGYDDD